MEIWLLEYRHDHGTDFSGHATQRAAERAAAYIVDDQCKTECTSEQITLIQGHIALGNFDEAIQIYVEHVTSEGLGVHLLNVSDDPFYNTVIADADTDVVHLAHSLPTVRSPGILWCDEAYFFPNAEFEKSFRYNGMTMLRGWVPWEKRAPTCLTCIAREVADG